MLIQITTTHQPATDLGYLLHKHPDRLQTLKLNFGKAHVFYPEATSEKTTVCLLLNFNSIENIKKKRGQNKGFTLAQYVNDRPYVASSFMSVALAKAFSTAMNGTCASKPELVETPLPLEVRIPTVSAPRGGEVLIRKFFEPLGYTIQIKQQLLDSEFPEWGKSNYFNVTLSNSIRLKDLLTHLYVLLPALDSDKHYFVSRDEIDKLLKKGAGWLEDHPEQEQIVRRYLLNFRSLSRLAMERLIPAVELETEEQANTASKRFISLHEKRLEAVFERLKESGAKTVLDLGCGEGKLLRMLLKSNQFDKITGIDISFSELQKAKERLYWEEMSPRQKERIQLLHSALTYRDKRLNGYDAAALVEVIEHLDEDRLNSLERVVFEFSKPRTAIVTTPNQEYNILFENMSDDQMRHDDHRFEWTRKEFEKWAAEVAGRYSYSYKIYPIGEEDVNVGPPSQMAVFNYEA